MTLNLLKVHLQTFISIPVTPKYKILSCDTLVANERYVEKYGLYLKRVIQSYYNDITEAPENIYIYKGKGKAVPLQAWTGPEGSRKLRFPDFVTTAQDSGKVVSLTHRPPLPPGNTPGTHFC